MRLLEGVRLSKISQIRCGNFHRKHGAFVSRFTVLRLDAQNVVLAKVTGSRTLESGLVVPTNFIVRTPKMKIIIIIT